MLNACLFKYKLYWGLHGRRSDSFPSQDALDWNFSNILFIWVRVRVYLEINSCDRLLEWEGIINSLGLLSTEIQHKTTLIGDLITLARLCPKADNLLSYL